MKTIGFFGDSYCTNPYSFVKGSDYRKKHNSCKWDTYIKKVERGLNGKVVHLGHGGSNIYDLILRQAFNFFKKKSLDYAIFVWTDPSRLYHSKYRELKPLDPENTTTYNDEERYLIKSYYRNFYSEDHVTFQATASITYFDKFIIPKYKIKKALHIFSCFDYDSISHLPISFENGKLLESTLWDRYNKNKPESYMNASNHIYGEEQNSDLANLIIEKFTND